jgi:hypothetical protein
LSRLNNESVYWALFFKVADNNQWNHELKKLLDQKLRDLDLMLALQLRTPDSGFNSGWGWQRWFLDHDVALKMYRRQPELLRPFLETFLLTPPLNLLDEAEKRADEEFLDFLTFQLLIYINQLAYRAFPSEATRRWYKPDKGAQEEVEKISGQLLRRLKRLHDQSPELYVRHVANTLSYFRAFQVWSYRDSVEKNPVFRHMVKEHHEAWQASPIGVRELLESPNIYIQIAGLDILATGGADAAERVLENLPMLKAMLLSRAKRNTKKRAINALVEAAQHGPRFAEAILPILETTMDFRGKRAIDDLVMVGYGRLQHQLKAANANGGR